MDELRKLAATRDEKRDRLFCAVASWRLEKCCLELRMRHLSHIMGSLVRAGRVGHDRYVAPVAT